MESLSIRLLGELELSCEKSKLPPSRRTRALLAYLTAERKAHSRERLCDLFWSGPSDPRAALRWSLSKLRAVLPLETHGEHVQLSEHVVSDLGLVERALGASVSNVETSVLVESARLFRGEPLEGLDVRDCFQFQEWLLLTREHWRAKELALLSELVSRLRASEPEQALAYARKRVAVDPLIEAGHVTVVELLGAVGRTKEAIAHFERCRRMLGSELGATHWPALEHARAALRAQNSVEASSLPPAPEVAPQRGACDWVGRQAELSLLAQTLSSGGVALVLGEPGIGKSRLLQAGAQAAGDAKTIVLRGRAFEAEMIRPYGAVIDALRSIPLLRFPRQDVAHLAPLLPDLASSTTPQNEGRERLFDGVLSFLRTLCRAESRVALVLDDVQWLDDASAALVHFLARVSQPGLAIALGARDGELEDNPPVLRLVRSLRRDKSLNEIQLLPLSSEETGTLLRSFGPSLDAPLIHQLSDGNPLFALELADAVGRGLAPSELPGTLLGLLSERLDRLDERARSLLPWAAVLGHSFALETLGAVSGNGPEELLRGVEELERRGVLKVAAAGSSQFGYDFVHDLVRRAAYQGLSEPRRRLCHARAAQVLWELVERDAGLGSDVAHHAALAGNHALAARACAQAGERCLRMFAYAEALELAHRGRRHTAQLPFKQRRALEIPLLELQVHVELPAQHDDLDAALSTSLSEADADGDRESIVAAATALAVLRYYRGDLPGAGDISLRAADAVREGEDPHLTANELAQSARCLTLVGRIQESRALLVEAIDVGQKHGVVPIELPFAQATLAQFDGQLESARELFQKTAETAQRSEDHWRGYEALARLTMIALETKQLARAQELVAQLGALAERMEKDGAERRFAGALSALIELRLAAIGGKTPLDTAAIEHELARLRAIDTKAFLVFSLSALAELELELKRPQAAKAHASEAAVLARKIKSRSDFVVATVLTIDACRAQDDALSAKAVLEAAQAELEAGEEISARARHFLTRSKALRP
jgi:DNA-binding SARP family transcriptional activator/tetratricopeptide (TPR) repeat protein